MNSHVERRPVQTDKAPKAIGPYSQAVVAGDFVFCSGQIGLDPSNGQLVPGGIEAQTRQALANLAQVLAAAGSSLNRVVKTSVFITSFDDFQSMNEVYASVFEGGDSLPARSTIAAVQLPRGAMVEIEAIAMLAQPAPVSARG